VRASRHWKHSREAKGYEHGSVAAATPYSANNAANNGLSRVYGNINLLGGTKVDLELQFVKQGTLEPVSLVSTDLTMFDMDGNIGVQEIVEQAPYHHVAQSLQHQSRQELQVTKSVIKQHERARTNSSHSACMKLEKMGCHDKCLILDARDK